MRDDDDGEYLGASTDVTASHARRAVGRASVVAWVLFGLTATVLAITSVVLARRYSDASSRLNTEITAHTDASIKLGKKEAELADANARAQKAEDALKQATSDRDALADKLKVAEDKLAKATAVAAAPTPATNPKKTTTKKTTKKKKH